MNNEVLAMILGGGQGSRLFPFTQHRSKPAVPIGGSYRLRVSNSLSGGNRELDEVPAVGAPRHLAQIGRGHRMSTGERQRRVALQ